MNIKEFNHLVEDKKATWIMKRNGKKYDSKAWNQYQGYVMGLDWTLGKISQYLQDPIELIPIDPILQLQEALMQTVKNQTKLSEVLATIIPALDNKIDELEKRVDNKQDQELIFGGENANPN